MPGLANTSQAYLTPLFNLNLYSPTNVYDLNNNALLSATIGVISSLNSTASSFTNGILSNILLPNTPIQQIANIQLVEAIALNAASNLRINILPSITVNGNGISLTDAGYWNISANNPTKSFSSLLDTILGFLPPVNPIPFESPIFDYKASNDYLKINRGEGQIDAYEANDDRNTYSSDNPNNQYVTTSNLLDNNSATSLITIIKANDTTNSNSILNITNQIINNNSVLNGKTIGYPSKIELPGDSLSPDALAYINPNGTGKTISRGDGTRVSDNSDIFLRVYNYKNTYGSTNSLMKFKAGNAGTNSVLNKTVFPNIFPTLESVSTDKSVKNLMFSIENLAYQGNTTPLQPYEVGPNGGRAMWFPPYDLQFNEATSNDWETVKFIGRSEPIYTYNGSERSVNISFKLIVDYPSAFWNNSWTTASNNDYDKFFRQDNNGNTNPSTTNSNNQSVAAQANVPQSPSKVANNQLSPYESNNKLTVNFDNGVTSLNEILTEPDINGVAQMNNNNFFAQIGGLISFLSTTQGQAFQVITDGFSSALNSDTTSNNQLSTQRAQSVTSYIQNGLTNQTTLPSNKFIINGHGSSAAVDQQSTIATINQDAIDRYATVYLQYSAALDTSYNSAPQDEVQNKNQVTTTNSQQTSQAQTNIQGGELIYFQRLQENNNLLFQKYSDEIKYFSPAFHSQTPDDFNTRLTFLEQCNRQSGSVKGVVNSIFGLPPVCVLRIGDFFHTKIIITNMTKAYDPLIWDMNPEGIGMQPMLCEVNLDCKVIGGQSLAGPLTKLQNALDYNFYANSENNKQTGFLATLDQLNDSPDQAGINSGNFQSTNSIASNLA